jgi:oligoribonuclease NrnB/cAMP/cGMP phosphodiesterase (DHH superfamily)
MSDRPLCIYHGNCADGFASAWVVWKAYNKEVDFHAGVYQDPPPDVDGREVIIVDFSYKRPVLLEMARKAKNILILDHHKTAAADLDNINKEAGNIRATFDMGRSGAMLTWMHYQLSSPPQLLLHIEDRDLWKFSLLRTREIQAALFSYPYEFELWDSLMMPPVSKLAEDGTAIERKHFKDIEELVAVCMHWRWIGGYKVPCASLPYTLTSDAGHLMAKNFAPNTFAACYWDTPSGRVFSLRSVHGGMDVGEIAKQFGGGGHKHASGFRAGWDTPLAAGPVVSMV